MLATIETGPALRQSVEIAQIFEDHHARIYRAAYRVTGNTVDAEDVVQGVFLRLLRREDESEAVNNLESYLYRAAINMALDVVRSRWSQSRVPLDEQAPLPSTRSAAGESARSVELRLWLRQALTALSPRLAEMFILRYIEGYANREIARMLDTSQAVVAVTLFRARSSLQKEFRKIAGGK